MQATPHATLSETPHATLHATLPSALAHHAAHSPQHIALHFAGQAINYQQLWQRVLVATQTLAAHGVLSGQRVAYLGLNDPAMLVLLIALQRLGAICLPLNYRLAPAELTAILQHADASLLVADSAHADIAATLLPGLHTVSAALFSGDANSTNVVPAVAPNTTPDTSPSAAPNLAPYTTPPETPPATTPALLVYTSGTTGLPKGALHTQAALVANCVISAHAHGLTASDHVLTALPLFHVGGLCIQTLPALFAGATVTLHARFDAAAWLAAVQRQRPSLSLMVPATLRAVLDHPQFGSTNVSSLRMLSAGSSTIPLALITPFHTRGVPVCQIYGATETGPVSIYLQAQHALQHTGSAGLAGLGIAVRLVDEQGNGAAVGAVGELWVQGPNVMQQYWRDADNPAFQNGWFHTGDLAHQDAQGFYTVVGRSKDMIISGGENIYPAELENLLANCPHIADCAVVGQSDARWGEVAVAVIVRQPHATLTEQDVMQLFNGQLARFKHPRRIVFTHSLPKTATGKVQKPQLLAQLSALPAEPV
jgi:fatty-acyl-CoA synthase